jgi:8-oxo-dGTP diphosphatase
MNDKLHSKDFPDCFYRVTIKGLCVRDGKILLVREGDSHSGKWEMPGGGLDFGENIGEAFKREIREEMGLNVRRMSERPVYVWTHRYNKKRGIDWYYSCVIAYQVEFEHLNITPTDECEEIRFFTKEELADFDLSAQTQELRDIFDPRDFEKAF